MNAASGSNNYDVAIVGGGVGGIYVGWRLATAVPAESEKLGRWAGNDGRLKVAVFEGSDRIGGRLLSARSSHMPHVTCEIGGMRFVSSQTLIRSLVLNKLKLAYHEQVVDDPTNIAFLRGQDLRVDQLIDPDALPYKLSAAEADWIKRNKAPPAGLIGWAMSQILPGLGNYHGEDLRQFLRDAVVDGTPLYQHGFWNLLARAMSSEAHALARTTVGYDVLAANSNAVDLTAEYFDFTPDVKYFLVDDGYETVPWTLEKEFEDHGGDVFRNAWLDGFDSTTLEDGSTGVELHFRDDRPSVTARTIVLAMPRRSLELLRPQGPVLDPARARQFQHLLNSVEPVALYKLFIVYGGPWWEEFGVSKGRSLTDIPIRQCYYWGVESAMKGADADNTSATIMAYNDLSSSEFWAGLRRRPLGPGDASMLYRGASPAAAGEAWEPPKRHGSRTRMFESAIAASASAENADDVYTRRLRKNWDDHESPHEMVTEMHRQLKTLHNARYAPEPIDAAFMNWSDDPYGGGVHLWNPGYKSWVVLDDMTAPVDDFPCYVCGEAYSTNQTWAEGALQTAEIVLQKHLGLPPPEWVTEE